MRDFTALVVAVLIPAACAAQNIDIKSKISLSVYGWSRSDRFKSPGGVFFDARKNEVYVADSGNGRILIFDQTGMPVAKIPHYVDGKGPGDSRTGEPKQVVVTSRGDILCVDGLAKYLDVMDYRGRSVGRVYPGELLGMGRDSVTCAAIAIDSDGNIYLGTGGDECTILILDPNLKLIRTIGKKGEGKGMFQSITGIWVDSGGKVYVTDGRGEPCVQVFSRDGQTVLAFGAHQSGPNNFSLPIGVVTDAQGDIYVLDGLRHLVAVFTAEGRYVARIIGGLGTRAGDLSYPTGMTGDGKDKIYTVEKLGARLQGFQVEVTPRNAAK